MNNRIFISLTVCLLAAVGSSYSIPTRLTSVTQQGLTQQRSPILRPRILLFSDPNDEENEASVSSTSPEPSAPKPTKIVNEPERTSYPIDLPSPILLSTSMVLAIIGTGSLFDLGGGSPALGFGPTAAIVAVAVPLCLFLFYASILKASAETEADDKEFMKGKY